MTTPTTSPAPTATDEIGQLHPVPLGSRVLRVAAGAALVAGPVLWAAGMWTSPPASGTTDLDYVTSLGREGTLTQVSALLLHYGNLALGLGVLAATSLVRGRAGSVLTVVGALLAALGLTNLAGMLLSDWWNLAATQTLPLDQAAELFGAFKASSLLGLWSGAELLCLVGPALLFVGLARAGVLSWWNPALFVASFVGLFFVPWDLPQVSAVAVFVGFLPFAVVGVRLLQRVRLGA